eukprot:TRINITY_DN3458_c0_g1_i1.p1 TRINITY_DN3458_c0_g1~~TRINITY_DN3458_c0_g1_i1.p1  ORF type:complete len:117 (-),score=35.01 TRINITY_DN3458_c0_g1_i1:63-377(-)
MSILSKQELDSNIVNELYSSDSKELQTNVLTDQFPAILDFVWTTNLELDTPGNIAPDDLCTNIGIKLSDTSSLNFRATSQDIGLLADSVRKALASADFFLQSKK